MAQRVGAAGVPVALLVTFSPVDSAPVSANVARAVNYFQSSSAFPDRSPGEPGFGALEMSISLRRRNHALEYRKSGAAARRHHRQGADAYPSAHAGGRNSATSWRTDD
jgi:hypothetical protein